jgi:hypothetical protein
MKKNQKISSLIVFSLLLLIVSCTKQVNSEETVINDSNAQEVLSFIKSLGYPSSSIVDNGKEFIVEGDIVYPKNMIVPKTTSRTGTEETYYTGSLVNLARQTDIKVLIDPSMSGQTPEINAAVGMWNNAASNLRFRVVTSAPADVTISAFGGPECGRAASASPFGVGPLNGLPGPTIQVWLAREANANFNMRRNLIAHEMGHTFGLAHTDANGSQPGIRVPNTPINLLDDVYSIMTSGHCDQELPGLSSYDIVAIQTLYPVPTTPNNSLIDITPPNFIVRWQGAAGIPSDVIAGYVVDYNGNNGTTSFGGTSPLLPVNTTSYTIPGVSSTAPGATGYFRATVSVRYASTGTSNYSGPLLSKYKTNGVWR